MDQTILIIEDEERLAHWVQTYFERAGFNTLITANGLTGLELARAEKPSLIILDLMLPGMDGTEICRVLRQESNVPIIMLTARSKEHDRIHGLDLGADDYVVKPFSLGELVARARAVLRRANKAAPHAEIVQSGNIRLDLAARTCMISGEDVKLSRTQFALLMALLRNPGCVMTREQLLDAAFEDAYDMSDRTIDVHIRRLRQRIEADPKNPRHILTVFGVGYKFVE
jgi:DNA-binding response OmpR family regulator